MSEQRNYPMQYRNSCAVYDGIGMAPPMLSTLELATKIKIKEALTSYLKKNIAGTARSRRMESTLIKPNTTVLTLDACLILPVVLV